MCHVISLLVFLHVRCIPHQNSLWQFWASKCVCVSVRLVSMQSVIIIYSTCVHTSTQHSLWSYLSAADLQLKHAKEKSPSNSLQTNVALRCAQVRREPLGARPLTAEEWRGYNQEVFVWLAAPSLHLRFLKCIIYLNLSNLWSGSAICLLQGVSQSCFL